MSTSSIEASLTESLTFPESFGLFPSIAFLLVVPLGSLLCNFRDFGSVILGVIAGASDNRMSGLNLLWQWSECNSVFFFMLGALYGVCKVHRHTWVFYKQVIQ